MVLTYSDGNLRSMVTQRAPYKVRKTDFLSREIENELVKLFKLEFELIQEIYAKTESLKYLYGFEIRKSFEYMDKFRINLLDENCICDFMTNNFKYVSLNDARFLLRRFDIDNDGKIGFGDYLFMMQMGKNNKINNSTKLNRLNYSLPNNFDINNENNTRINNSSILNRSLFNYNNDENSKVKDRFSNTNYNQKFNININNDFTKDNYVHLSYRKGEDPDIDTLRFNTSGLNFDPRRNSKLDKMNISEDKNILKTSIISSNY